MAQPTDEPAREQLLDLEQHFVQRAGDAAVFLVFDRPERVDERPGLSRTFFAQRCASDEELERLVSAFRSVGAYVELFAGEHPLLEGLTSGRLQAIRRRLKVIYNGIESCVGVEGFEPGRKALLPAVADSYGLVSTNSNAYGCAVGRHKFHYFVLLRALGIDTPRVWHYRPPYAWIGAAPPAETKVIVKSTYESWSVGVTDSSIFVVGDDCEARVAAIAADIGQPVTVQEFVPGTEVNVPVFSFPHRVVSPPVQSVLAKAPGDPNAVVTIDDNLAHTALTYRRLEAPAEVVERLKRTASAVFDVLELQAFARVDFRLDIDGRAWVTDVGVEPGLAVEGSAARSLDALGIDHATFLRIVIAAALGTRGLLD